MIHIDSLDHHFEGAFGLKTMVCDDGSFLCVLWKTDQNHILFLWFDGDSNNISTYVPSLLFIVITMQCMATGKGFVDKLDFRTSWYMYYGSLYLIEFSSVGLTWTYDTWFLPGWIDLRTLYFSIDLERSHDIWSSLSL